MAVLNIAVLAQMICAKALQSLATTGMWTRMSTRKMEQMGLGFFL